MRSFSLLLFAPLLAWAQFPPAQLSGVLLERDPNVPAGEFSVRAPDNQVFRYQFDAKTAVEISGLPSSINALNPGEKVEVDSEVAAGSVLRYAKAIRAQTVATPRMTLADTRIHAPVRSVLDRIQPTANLSFAGVVSRTSSDSLVIHTRLGDQTFLIRKDTRYIDNGDTVEAGALRPNMRVFVRAGKNLYEQVEAYQVIWGQILEPKR